MRFELRRQYLDSIRWRYKGARKKDKKIILDEFCRVCGYSRKYAIRILRGQITPRSKRPGPKLIYPESLNEILQSLWFHMGEIGARKLKAALPLWLPFSKDIDHSTKTLILKMSAATLDRRLEKFRIINGKGLSTTTPSMLKNLIPIKLLDEDVKRPGYIEADTVAHCGEAIAGHYANTVTMTDLYSGWTETRAVWTKGSEGVLKAIELIEMELPFAIERFACDNGTEFLNSDLYRFFSKRKTPVEFYRRRPYKKNDAAHVEQKNYTHVRKLFGYERYDHPDLVVLMNEIYRVYWCPLQNFFIPTMKLKSKTRIGSKIKKVYDEPKTPCQRLLECSDLPRHYKQQLKDQLKGKNPFYLKEELDRKLKIFNKVVDIHQDKQRLASL